MNQTPLVVIRDIFFCWLGDDMLPNTCYSIRTRKQIPMMRFLKNPEAGEFQFLRKRSLMPCWHQDASSWHVYSYAFVCCKSQLQEFNHPSSTKPSHDGFEHPGPRHDVVIKILLDIHLLSTNAAFCWCWPCWFPCPYLFKIELKQPPVTANSFQICPFLVKQLLLLILQYHTIPIYHSRALCKFKVLCFTNLNEAQFFLEGDKSVFFGVHWVHFYFPFNSAQPSSAPCTPLPIASF